MSRARAVTFNHNPLLRLGLPVWRARVVLFLLFMGMAMLVVRSAYLQGINRKFLQEQGASRYSRVLKVPADRGQIADRNGVMLAVSAPARAIWAVPTDAAQLAPGQLRQLGQLLGMSVSEIGTLLSVKRNNVFLKRQLSSELADQVVALGLPGIHQQTESRRFYPRGELTSHVLGFTDVDGRGQEGIELAYEKLLAGQAGLRRVLKNLHGQVVENVELLRPPRQGQNIVLAMDINIQYQAHTALHEAVAQHRAKAGAVVVIDVRTGEILAMVNAPTFNPNNRANLVGAQLRNRVLTDIFEPGSIMKPFIAAMALESGRFRPDTLIDTRPGRMKIGGWEISDNGHNHGVITMAEVIQKSSNIGTAKIALSFSPEYMWNTYYRLGFGAPLDLGFPGERRGSLQPVRYWKPVEQATMSYGHGISVTLIQMARAYLAFARDGDLLPLSLTRVDTVPQGTRVFSPQVVREVRAMMEMVANPGGTATRARVAGYRVAGKTGTANKIEGGRYVDKYVASFVGFAPVSNPRLVVAVMIDEPSVARHFGGQVAAPVFAQVLEGALRTLGVAPDAPLAPLQLTATTPDDAARAGEGM
jgi:cell division protein FtsI (penicillin-binding protein 3)